MSGRSHPHGFATLIAIVLLAVVSGALVVLARRVSYEVSRTRTTAEDAQLRQLLMAGARRAVAKSAVWGNSPVAATWQMHLPEPLASAGASVSLDLAPTPEGTVKVRIEARVEPRQALQTLDFKHVNGMWYAAGAHLGP